MLRRHWLIGMFCASLGSSLGCEGNFETAGVNDPNADSTQPGSSLRALPSSVFGRHRFGTGGQSGGSSGTAGAASGGQSGGSSGAAGAATGGHTGGTTGAAGAATGGHTGGTTGAAGAATGGHTGGTTGAATGGTTGAAGAPSTPGTGGSVVTGTGGSTGASGTCGNGKLDPGEACDGSAMQGATCASLGFTGGSLACSSTCQFNASSCTGGTIAPTITASRTSCTAPCGVFFDTTSTAGLAGGDYVLANWSWDFADAASAHKGTVGMTAAHVYDSPGTYPATVRVRDSSGAAGWATKTITVSAASYTTYYVSTAGSDTNDGLSTSKPFKTVAHAVGLLGSNVAILLRRGDTFSGGSSTINLVGPAKIGAYTDPSAPSSVAPTLTSTIPGSTFNAVFSLSGTDARVTDINVNASGVFTLAQCVSATNGLVERVEAENIGFFDSSSGYYTGINFYADTGSNGSFFFDNNLHDFMGYGFYGADVHRLAMTGNTIQRFTEGQHGVRVQGGSLVAATENTIIGPDVSSPQSAITIRGNNTNIVLANNVTNRLVEFTPQYEGAVELVQNGLLEGNTIIDNRTTGFYQNSVGIVAKHIVARNNVVGGNSVGFALAMQSGLPANWLDQIFIYNNTMNFSPASYPADFGANLVTTGGTKGTLTVRNNIMASNLASTGSPFGFVSSDGQGTIVEDHNLGSDPSYKGTWRPGSGTGDIVGDAKFVSTTGASAYRLQSTSAARNAGTSAPAYQDSASVIRTTGAWDLGAYQYTP